MPSTFRYSSAVLVAALCAVTQIASRPLRAQDAAAARALELSKETIANDLGRLASEGYRVLLADVQAALLVVQRTNESRPRYIFIDDVASRLSKSSGPSERLVPATMLAHGRLFSGLFAADDDHRHDYVFVEAGSPDDVAKKARALSPEHLMPVAIDIGERVGAVFERVASAQPWQIVTAKRTSTMQETLAGLGRDGYRIVDSSGGRELTYLVVKAADPTAAEYRLIATTKSTTFERELNEAAKEGFTFVPASLASMAGGGSGFRLPARATNEVVGVMERSARRATYKAIGARRRATLDQELADATGQGFVAIAAVVGYEETVIVLERPEAEP